MTKFTEHAIGHRRGTQVNTAYVFDTMQNLQSSVPENLCLGLLENKLTGRLEPHRGEDEAENTAKKIEGKIAYFQFSKETNDRGRDELKSTECLVKLSSERTLDFHRNARSKRAMKMFNDECARTSARTMRWRAVWDLERKIFQVNPRNEDGRDRNGRDGDEHEAKIVQMENGGVVRRANIGECSYDCDRREFCVYLAEDERLRAMYGKHDVVGTCVNAFELLKRMSECDTNNIFDSKTKNDDNDDKEEDFVSFSVVAHGVAEDAGAGLIAAKIRSKDEREKLILKSETEEETAKRLVKEMNKVKSSVIDALKFATTNEKRKAVTENINDNNAKKKMSRFDEEDDSDSDS